MSDHNYLIDLYSKANGDKNFAEMKELVKLGDFHPDEYRAHYKKVFGTNTSMTNDEIIHMIASCDDDGTPEDWAHLMKKLEGEKPVVIPN